jgi:hypothetical protein
MAASIKDSRSEIKEKKAVLIDRMDGLDNDILCATLLPKEDGFISASDDKFVYFNLFIILAFSFG